jgi:hypothetical protein
MVTFASLPSSATLNAFLPSSPSTSAPLLLAAVGSEKSLDRSVSTCIMRSRGISMSSYLTLKLGAFVERKVRIRS